MRGNISPFIHITSHPTSTSVHAQLHYHLFILYILHLTLTLNFTVFLKYEYFSSTKNRRMAYKFQGDSSRSGNLIPELTSLNFLFPGNCWSQCFQRNPSRCSLISSSNQFRDSTSGLFLSGFVIKVLRELPISRMSCSFYRHQMISPISPYFLSVKLKHFRMLLFSTAPPPNCVKRR
jgi:hypothetical protein